MICRNKDYKGEETMEEYKPKENGTYRVHAISNGFKIAPRNYQELFQTSSKDDTNVLLYLPEEAIDTPNHSGMCLAYRLAEIPRFKVGITTHADVEHAEYADVILGGYLGDPFDNELEGRYKDKVIFSGKEQRKQFTRKTIEQVVGLIEDQVEALVA